MTASLLSGSRLIWLVNKASWSVVTAQVSFCFLFDASGPTSREEKNLWADEKAPAMGTIWILTIVQLPLSRALLCLIGVAGWVWWTGMNIYP